MESVYDNRFLSSRRGDYEKGEECRRSSSSGVGYHWIPPFHSQLWAICPEIRLSRSKSQSYYQIGFQEKVRRGKSTIQRIHMRITSGVFEEKSHKEYLRHGQ